MTRIRVSGSYDVNIGDLPELSLEKPFIVTDENVWRAQRSAVGNLGPTLILPPGEQTKCAATWQRCLSWLSLHGADRESTIVAFGGGVVGDLAGFVAASYMRGVRYVQVATSLVAQVDSSVGGKTGIDIPEGKNLAGAFYDPQSVWCDPQHLETLTDREFINGMAEVLKYGFILDSGFLGWLERERRPIAERHPEALRHLVERCVDAKASVIDEDPFERTGRRSILNFGHTVGHALEQVLDYEDLLHGEAVMIGMVAEAEIGERLGITELGAREQIEAFAASYDLPASLPSAGLADKMLGTMLRDKKATDGQLSMALLIRIGECKLVTGVDSDLVQEVLSQGGGL
ncbi:MAG: 3-dehydroquinate synthase [Fimbriimonadales bacterium]